MSAMKTMNAGTSGARASVRRSSRAASSYNDETVAAIREADRIAREIAAGRRRPKTLQAMLAEIESI